ncbi:hypothetical protein HAX54_041061 [Datura stramonium]|uniref:Uncharacterized protein n=1 Tax=Datura stramonium TaxID=4076 RepID=A0ABS8SL20_DATST|nr:hypothetical protein [Datura stramonium]
MEEIKTSHNEYQSEKNYHFGARAARVEYERTLQDEISTCFRDHDAKLVPGNKKLLKCENQMGPCRVKSNARSGCSLELMLRDKRKRELNLFQNKQANIEPPVVMVENLPLVMRDVAVAVSLREMSPRALSRPRS